MHYLQRHNCTPTVLVVHWRTFACWLLPSPPHGHSRTRAGRYQYVSAGYSGGVRGTGTDPAWLAVERGAETLAQVCIQGGVQ